MKAGACVSKSDVHGVQPIPWLMAYDCGKNEGRCLHVNRSDARGMRPMPCPMAYCTAVVTVKASACVSARSNAHGLRLMPWLMVCCTAVLTMKASVCVSVDEMHGGCKLCPGYGNSEGGCLWVSRSDTWDATYALADGVPYGCGNNEGICLCVSRSDVHGIQPIPWPMVLYDW